MVATVDVILSGKITGDPDYRVKFAVARVEARKRFGAAARIWNPAELPAGRDYDWYMDECLAVIKALHNRGAVFVRLNDWDGSKGARCEVATAECYGLAVVGQWW